MARTPQVAGKKMWAQVDKAGPVPEHRPDLGPCWIWTGWRKKDGGYGLVSYKDKTRVVHRLIYELLVGPIPDGLTIDHLCRVRHCVNPTHMEPVTVKVNTLRGETLAARNAVATHCAHGHEFTEDNTRYGYPRGIRSRICRTCRNDRARRRYAARRLA